jgi:hypothetical protein
MRTILQPLLEVRSNCYHYCLLQFLSFLFIYLFVVQDMYGNGFKRNLNILARESDQLRSLVHQSVIYSKLMAMKMELTNKTSTRRF